jgi:hypothetical protein
MFTNWLRSEEASAVSTIVIASRVGVLLAGWLGIVLIGYAPDTPPYRVYGTDFLDMPARWDTGWYLGIAEHGYSYRPSGSNPQQNIAFFPAYPLLMRYGAWLVPGQTLWVGVAVSLIAFFAAAFYLFRLARMYLDRTAAAAAVALLATYPFALFYSAAYTEALFLLTIVAACYHFEREELWQAGLWGLVAGLTRPNGCLLSVVLGLMAVRGYRAMPWRVIADRIAVAATPGIGMLIYSTFIYFLTGNPLQWAAQNAAWGRVYRRLDALVTDHVRYIQINGWYDYTMTQSLDIVHVLAVVLALGSAWPVYRRFGLPYAVMIVINVVLPLTMGGLLSMGRVTAVLFPVFLWLGAAIPARHRSAWLIGFAMLQGIFAVAFFTWRPVY